MESNQNLSKKNNKIKLDFKDSKYATGRRKTSIARLYMKSGKGVFKINGLDFEKYFTL